MQFINFNNLESHSIHIPVLVEEVITLLDLQPGETVVDATIGDGGHAARMLEKISPGGCLVGLDRDPEAVESAYEKLSRQKSNAKFVIVHGSFGHLDRIIQNAGCRGVDAILFDLGLSSRELAGQRGFSFQTDAPLDMRFDPDDDLTAAEIVNSYPRDRLADLIFKFGEERASRRIAEAIVRARRKEKITSTLRLAEIVAQAKGGRPQRSRGRHSRIHPATQTFQALRIAVNEELSLLAIAVPEAIRLLNPGGRVAIISYHSLEDRIVKNIFRDTVRAGIGKLINKKPIIPGRAEITANPRARSAKLRVITKIDN